MNSAQRGRAARDRGLVQREAVDRALMALVDAILRMETIPSVQLEHIAAIASCVHKHPRETMEEIPKRTKRITRSNIQRLVTLLVSRCKALAETMEKESAPAQ